VTELRLLVGSDDHLDLLAATSHGMSDLAVRLLLGNAIYDRIVRHAGLGGRTFVVLDRERTEGPVLDEVDGVRPDLHLPADCGISVLRPVR
jgi:hypothetical protein